MALVAVDTGRSVPGVMPPTDVVAHPGLAVVRFHGRSAAWGTGSKEDRFRHRYTASPPRGTAHVLFNNCCAGAAVDSAATMRQLLTEV
ncbi:DUF72 domain-containing protein [Streptomyces sp. ISL-11]|uniref:DUF72 domain-containing protein n=1 Tax=Streptomyces sp. ISL-11 TaxID=2819174 RepID=UPI001BEB4711|nr:hypothetical protein [Streptomyces sp. ISL-11]